MRTPRSCPGYEGAYCRTRRVGSGAQVLSCRSGSHLEGSTCFATVRACARSPLENAHTLVGPSAWSGDQAGILPLVGSSSVTTPPISEESHLCLSVSVSQPLSPRLVLRPPSSGATSDTSSTGPRGKPVVGMSEDNVAVSWIWFQGVSSSHRQNRSTCSRRIRGLSQI